MLIAMPYGKDVTYRWWAALRYWTGRDGDRNLGCFHETGCSPFLNSLHLWLSSPKFRLQLPQACGVGGVPWDHIVYSQSSVRGTRTWCMFFNSVQAEYLATNQLSCGILSLGGSVFKGLGLKKVERLEWNSASRRQPVLWVQMHFFEISLAELKNKVLKIGF